MLPKELEDVFEQHTEDDYSLLVTGADYSSGDFELRFDLNIQDIDDKGAVRQEWVIEATGYRQSHVAFGFAGFIEIISDHSLLWEFTDVQCELYFTGHCKDAPRVFYDLYQVHKNTFGTHKCFTMSAAEDWDYFRPFRFSNGLLTKGPKKLMEKYAACLTQNGLGYSILGERQATYWDGDQLRSGEPDLKLLFLGDTYVIAKEFSFSKNNASGPLNT